MMGCRKLFVLLLCGTGLCLANVKHSKDPTLVTLPDGRIRGQALRSPKDKVYYAFQEIPYAAPPVGKLRFQPPQAPAKWDGVLNTTRNTKICFQNGVAFVIPDVVQTEDCLYLNVFTPVKPGDSSKAPLSVLIWIHGGGYVYGTGIPQLYRPQFLIDYNIVVVTLNYRLGALGFLTTEDGVIAGNIGLKDMRQAVQWVRQNIHLFGGDPKSITISGESAGAAAAGLLAINKKDKGVYKNLIMESGSPLVQWTRQAYARYYAFKLGRSLDPNFTSNDSKDLLKLLQSVPVSMIDNNTVTPDIGKETSLYKGMGYIWVPVIEDANQEGAIVTGLIHEDIKNGNINKIPTLLGFNSEEYLFYVNDDPTLPEKNAKYFDNDVSNLVRNRFNMTQENKLAAGKKLKKVYTDGLFQDDIPAAIRFMSDELFPISVIRQAKLESKYTDIYMYQFSYKGKMGGLQNINATGVGHAEDLGYLWNAPVNPYDTPDDPEDLVTRHRLLTLWTNFVKYSNPTPTKDKSLCNVIWKKVAPNDLAYLDINKTLEMRKNPREYLKWEKIVDEYATFPLISY